MPWFEEMPAQWEHGQLPAPLPCQVRSSACTGAASLGWAGMLLPQGTGKRMGMDQASPRVGRKQPGWEVQEHGGFLVTTVVLLSKEKRFLTTL